MPRDHGRNLTRERIAHLAARVMAEDGVEDYALAKRKAARQAGTPDTRELPTNDEIDAALRVYREIYQQEHGTQLRALRQLALAVMAELARFNPYLTGSVLKGSAGKYAAIHLQLFTESPKQVELHLLNERINFRTGSRRLFAGHLVMDAPVLMFARDEVEIHLTLLTPRDQRLSLKASVDGKPIERARREAVEALLAG
jgi:hypothetical protein